jgi:hypothetical protein
MSLSQLSKCFTPLLACTRTSALSALRTFPQHAFHTSPYIATHRHTSPQVLSTGELHLTVEPLTEPYVGVSVLSLTRPDARNAIGRQLLSELQEALTILRQERSTRCVIVRSLVPNVFCAGADLKERSRMSQVSVLFRWRNPYQSGNMFLL